jgi:hypothetical protein
VLPGLLIGFLALGSTAAAQSTPSDARSATGVIGEWARSLEPDARASRELAAYRGNGGGPLGEAYRAALASRVHAALFAAASRQVDRFLEGACEPFVDVTFGSSTLDPAAGDRPRRGDEGRFEGGLVRVESVACLALPDVSAERALRVFTSPEFRSSQESRIRTIREEGDESCVETGAVPGLLSPSHACNRIRRLVHARVASEHSQAIRNAGGDGFQPVYLKESLKTFVEIPGGLAVHYIHYSRTADIGGVERWVAARRIRASEARKADAIADRLRKATPLP